MVRAPVHLAIALLVALASAGVTADPPVLELPDDEAHQTPLGAPVDYLTEIKPILVRRCYTCHGPDPSTRSGSFRLDDRSSATRMRDGYQVIRPGKAAESELIARIHSMDPSERMPPDGPRLTKAETDLIQRWIDQGSPYEEHWSFKPITDPPPPPVPSAPAGSIRDPLDQFILARLEAAGVSCSDDASPAQQLRRLSTDLTGFPPSEEDILAFEADPSDERWTGLVEQYLSDPAFGERWGRHWLDLVRYAETCGHEFDYPIHDAWKYRDYVIRSLNADVPYDRFVREHIAGDLIDPRIDEESGVDQSVLATGFWHLHQAVHGPVDVRQDELERIDNQIDVLTKTFMGLTVSCARCHDHKFDPITQMDYYGLSGILRSSRRTQAYLDPDDEIEQARESVIRMLERVHPELQASGREADRLLPMTDLLDRLRTALAESGTEDALPSETLFAGFDDETFEGWETTGNAFARGPQSIDTVREPFRAQFGPSDGMVNTCDDRPGGNGDGDTGTLLSPEFTIDHAEIALRMSGGRDPVRTCVQLLVEGTVVHSAHGRDDVVMREIRWDTRPHRGKSGRIRILDTDIGAWGHVAVDDIRFRSIPGYSGALTEPIQQVAQETTLSEQAAIQWLAALNDDEIADHEHPLNRWSIEPRGPTVGPVAAAVLADRTGPKWRDSGHAWPRTPDHPLDSGWLGGPFQGTLRSDAFTLDHDWVLVRARGKGTIRLCVDGFMMDQFNPLLFEGMIQGIDGPWSVVKIPVAAYIGERAWLELIDDSEGGLEIDWIAFDDAPEAVVPRETPSDPSWSDDAVRDWLVRNELVGRLPLAVGNHDDHLVRRQGRLRELTERVAAPTRALAMQDGNVLEELVLLRGSHRTPGPPAPRALVDAICGTLEIDSGGSGRLELAEQILDEGNPLTARVAVNRIWQHLFGRGIVETSDDFGALGAMPTHPELLDHLAVDFSRDWSIKRMIRRMVQSSTYRRSSTPVDDQVLEIDPTNTLLARASIRRLDAEAIRDGTLFIAGQLEDRRHGPPVPIHLTSFMDGRGRPASSGPVDGDGRRSIYLEVRRNFPSPLLAVFDRPIPSSTNGRRNRSNVPAQALTMMNDEFIHRMAEAWATRSMRHGELDRIWRQAFARAPTPEELEMCRAFLEERPQDDQSWTELCHALMNTKEYIYLH